MCGLVTTADAGSASGTTSSLKFSINDDAGQSIGSQDLTDVLSFDPAAGTVSTPAPGAALTGNWSWSNTDLVTGETLSQQVLTWHTSERISTNGPWVSVVQLKATGNVDPFLSYSFSAKNNTSLSQTFTFSYGESITPAIDGAYSVVSDFAGSLTHGSISPVAQMAPIFGDFDNDGLAEIQALKLSTDGGLTLVDAGVDLGTTQTRAAAGTMVFGPYSSSQNGDLGTVNYWQFDVGFTLTPGKDAVGISGYAEIVPSANIPEPSAYALLASGLVMGGVLLRRRIFPADQSS